MNNNHHYVYLKIQRDGKDQQFGYIELCKVDGNLLLDAVVKALERDKNNILKSINGKGLGPNDSVEIEVKTLNLNGVFKR